MKGEFEGHPAFIHKEIQMYMTELMNNQTPYVKVKISKPRNYQFHKKFFALCKVASLLSNESQDGARDIITIKAGHYTAHTVKSKPSGDIEKVLKRIENCIWQMTDTPEPNLMTVHDTLVVCYEVINALTSEYTYYKPLSISWAKMDQDEFTEFYEKAKLVVCEIWDFDKEQLEKLIQF